ncbi:ribbon-helix-helix domain-containing protein [Candidatus Woesearchaeota archaeon]|nr:ribbon-helix-helix domain-containing protein [Candidatus Woesearchaeota archaeon]MBW3005943.1 ribbon-helix-helix domain-containing protein [Candidatus Woesearchaeota archaeon]
MVSIHLRLTKELAKQISSIEKQFGFNSAQEFIRAAIRNTIDEYEKRQALRGLKKLYGTAKAKKNPPSRQEVFEMLAKKKSSDIFRKYGL